MSMAILRRSGHSNPLPLRSRAEAPDEVRRRVGAGFCRVLAGGAMKYRVIIKPDEDGVFVAESPSRPGCTSQGSTRSEAKESISVAGEGGMGFRIDPTCRANCLNPAGPVWR